MRRIKRKQKRKKSMRVKRTRAHTNNRSENRYLSSPINAHLTRSGARCSRLCSARARTHAHIRSNRWLFCLRRRSVHFALGGGLISRSQSHGARETRPTTANEVRKIRVLFCSWRKGSIQADSEPRMPRKEEKAGNKRNVRAF